MSKNATLTLYTIRLLHGNHIYGMNPDQIMQIHFISYAGMFARPMLSSSIFIRSPSSFYFSSTRCIRSILYRNKSKVDR